jgi:hypothetical protein
LHDAQTHAGSGLGGRLDADAIVADGQNNFAIRVRHADFDQAGFAVFDGVANRFLRDAIKMGGRGLIGSIETGPSLLK